MRIAFVVDTEYSALFTSANQWCKFADGEIFTTTHFLSFKNLLSKLIAYQPDLVIFSWRQVLDMAFLSRRYIELLNVLKNKSQLLALVADHAADHPDRLEKDRKLIEANIGLVTVTERLYRFYTEIGLVPFGILPDRPDCDLIREIRAERSTPTPKSVIWIGNSQWGKRQGYIDHKGLHSKFKPFLNLAIANGIPIESIVIDSAVRKVSQRDVIRNLAHSELLMVTSASEGTCLPILEALGVGTNVISTDVGIANMFTTVRSIPIDASPREIFESFMQWEQAKVPSHEAISDFERYIYRVGKYWQELVFKVESSTLSTTPPTELESRGFKVRFELLFWKLKFAAKWLRTQYVKSNK